MLQKKKQSLATLFWYSFTYYTKLCSNFTYIQKKLALEVDQLLRDFIQDTQEKMRESVRESLTFCEANLNEQLHAAEGFYIFYRVQPLIISR